MKQNFNNKATVIVSTYNQPLYLSFVLAGLTLQTKKDFEVCIADDGSTDKTKEVISRYRNKLNLKHLWQEDKGFRKSAILNKAILESKNEYIIFLDGDCLPHKCFVEMHLKNAEPKSYLAGRRVELGKDFTSKITEEYILSGAFDKYNPALHIDCTFRDSKFFHRSRITKNPIFRKLFNLDKLYDAKGSNISVHKEALAAINGFDEKYEGYGREDTDLELRLKNYGLAIKSVKSLAIQYHLYHERRKFTDANEVLLDNLKQSSEIFRCENGINKES